MSEAEAKLRKFMLQRFPGMKGKADDAALIDSGAIDSLGILDIAEFLSSDLKLQVDDDDLVPENFQTFASLLRFVELRRGG